MKKIQVSILFLVFINVAVFPQKLALISDHRESTIVYDNGKQTTLTSQKYISGKTGYKQILFEDISNRLFAYTKNSKILVEPAFEEYYAKKSMAAYIQGNILIQIKEGKKNILSMNSPYFSIEDDLIVYYDQPKKYFKAIYQDSIYKLEDMLASHKIVKYSSSDNLIVYESEKENSIKIFDKGVIYYALPKLEGLKFDAGRNIAAFNNRTDNTFSVFYMGQMQTVEYFPAERFHCGDNLVAYIDNTGMFKCFKQNQIITLSTFAPSKIHINDSILIYEDGGKLFYLNGFVPEEITNYIPTQYFSKNNIIIYKDAQNNYNYIFNNKKGEIEDRQIRSVEVQGQLIVYKTNINTYKVIDPEQ